MVCFLARWFLARASPQVWPPCLARPPGAPKHPRMRPPGWPHQGCAFGAPGGWARPGGPAWGEALARNDMARNQTMRPPILVPVQLQGAGSLQVLRHLRCVLLEQGAGLLVEVLRDLGPRFLNLCMSQVLSPGTVLQVLHDEDEDEEREQVVLPETLLGCPQSKTTTSILGSANFRSAAGVSTLELH